MKKIVYILLLIISIISCSIVDDKNRLIAGDSCQYWYLLTPDSEGKTKFFYYFDRQGRWIILEESFRDKRVRLHKVDDVEYYPTWLLKSDSVINIGRLDRRLDVINDTFIIIRTEKYHWIDTLYKVTDTHLLKELQKVPIPK